MENKTNIKLSADFSKEVRKTKRVKSKVKHSLTQPEVDFLITSIRGTINTYANKADFFKNSMQNNIAYGYYYLADKQKNIYLKAKEEIKKLSAIQRKLKRLKI